MSLRTSFQKLIRRDLGRPSLRERTAELQAELARVTRPAADISPAETRQPASDPTDWHSPPPGFMTSPAIEPFGFACIPEGIAIELARLHGIALAEFERQAATRATDEGIEHLHRELRLDALERAVRGEGVFAINAGAAATVDLSRAILEGWAAWGATLGKPEEDAEATAAWERACEHRDRLLDAAEALPATHENINAKALARLWMDWVEDERPGQTRETFAFNGRMAFDVNAAIMACVDRPTAIVDATASALSPDLSNASINQLARLYDHLQSMAYIASTACNAPMAWDDKRSNLNSIGHLLDAEHCRLDELAERVAAAIQSRTPDSDDERDVRLAIIVKRQMEVFSSIDDPALATEVAAAWIPPAP